MRTVTAIPVAKAAQDDGKNPKISGDTIVKESGGSETDVSHSMYDDDSFVDINLDDNPISNDLMQKWMAGL